MTKGTTSIISGNVHTPLVWCQAASNRVCVPSVCAQCGKCVGSLISQLATGCGLVSRAVMLESRGQHLRLKSSLQLPDLAGETSDESANTVLPIVPCVDNCGEVYCSIECRDLDALLTHGVLCVGAHTETHPIYLFKITALQSGAFDTIAIAAKLVLLASIPSNLTNDNQFHATDTPSDWESVYTASAAALKIWQQCANSSSSFSSSSSSASDHSDENTNVLQPWYNLLPVHLDAEERLVAQDENRQITEASWRLLSLAAAEQGRPLQLISDNNSLVELSSSDEDHNTTSTAEEVWARLLTFVAANATEWGISTPVERYIQRLSCQRPTVLAQAKSMLTRCARSVLDADHEEEDESDDENEREEEQATDEQLFVKVLIDPVASVAPRMQAVALFPSLFHIPHSCLPTHSLATYTGAVATGESAMTICCEPITRDDNHDRKASLPLPATISRVDFTDDYWDREAALILRNVKRCTCDRCVVERALLEAEEEGDDEKDDENESLLLRDITDETLRTVADAAARSDRYDDAIQVLDVLLRRHPHDGDVLYKKARVVAWGDEWSEGSRLLHSAKHLAQPPDHTEIRAALEQETRYFSGTECAQTLTPRDTDQTFCMGRVVVRKGLLSPNECDDVISSVEAHIGGETGWTTSRHYAVPTTDITVSSVPSVLDWFNAALKNRLFPLVAGQFNVEASSLRLIDAFVVKYTAEAQRSLPLHVDQSEYSLTIALNSLTEYEGGGAVFADTGDVVNGNAGDVIAFDGSLMHGGYPVSQGTRYIIVAFMYAYHDIDDGNDDYDDDDEDGGVSDEDQTSELRRMTGA